MEWHLRYDRINCSVCGNFYTRLAGGLRTHMVQEHKIENEAVRDKMFQNSWQLVVYVPPSSTSKIAEAGNLTTRNTIEADCLCSFTKNENSSIEHVNINQNGNLNSAKDEEASDKDLWLDIAKSSDIRRIKELKYKYLNTQTHSPILAKSESHLTWNPFRCALDKDGNSLLTWAAGNGNLELCKYLVEECGMSPHIGFIGRRGRSRRPLHWAAR